ncbi:cytochrome-c peroxidase [Sorangium sp. So ce861]|uniref:cytochrome-c peroxidase n=1 Tax=Sorangium sp. So ce861 TaxID=3133323 RepID=UPI003F6032BE
MHEFKRQTFGGNGRTCSTCHGDETGTFSPADAQALFAKDPDHPLFRPLDSDDGTTGASYDRLLQHATVLVTIALPPNVRLADDPTAEHVTVERGTPTTFDTPALDPVLMQDGRAPDLATQARDAIRSHMEPTVEPTDQQIERIVQFERKLFSSKAMSKLAKYGTDPGLPAGKTASEQRGRRFFVSQPLNLPDLAGFCAQCHSGPMLNETNEFEMLGRPVGTRFGDILVSGRNIRDLPVYRFLFTNPDGTTVTVESPDPGRALITGQLSDVDAFKTPTLRNTRSTAPYFHDNSAKTLEDVVEHYDFFARSLSGGAFGFSEQDKIDIAAYMRLL